MIQPSTITLTASDVTGQRRVTAPGIPVDSTVGELLDRLVPSMNLKRFDAEGRELQVQVRSTREQRHLLREEKVGDVLRHEDHLTLEPRIMAG